MPLYRRLTHRPGLNKLILGGALACVASVVPQMALAKDKDSTKSRLNGTSIRSNSDFGINSDRYQTREDRIRGCYDETCACRPEILAFPNNSFANSAGETIPVVLEAQNVETEGDKAVILQGKAFVGQGRQSISAERIRYSKEDDQVEADGNVTLRSVAGDKVTAESVELDINSQIGSAKNATFKLAERGIISDETNAVAIQSRGKAKAISLEGQDFVRLQNVDYTTCKEGQDDFFVRAKNLELDQATGMGTATNASIIFKGVPIFYAPRFTFPINDERKSGFLYPFIGSDSDSGFVFGVPWYWNIAPQMDATFYPRFFSDRGVQLGTEFRHLSENSETEIKAEYLPSDKEFEDEDRYAFSVQHQRDFTRRLRGTLDYNDVSDQEYFQDFSSDIRTFSATYIPRTARLNYSADYWTLNTSINDYELVDSEISEENAPFDRLPDIRFRGNFPKVAGIEFDLEASATNFSHDVKQEGWRYLVEPSVSVPLRKIWGYLTPTLGVNHASYDVDDFDADSRTVPIFSVDSGVYFEKRTTFMGESAIQTLEPRVFFVYTGDDDQENIPVFDSKPLSFNNFSNLFSTSGFSGGDQVNADNRQITLSLTSRIYDQNGAQRLKASIGQAFFLEDREITQRTSVEQADGTFVVEETVETQSRSDLLAEATLNLGDFWELGAFLQYDTDDTDIRTADFDIEYREAYRKYFELGYRFSDLNTEIDQLYFEGEWPLNDHWSVFGIERYDIEDSTSLQTRLGFEYDGCCWRFRIAADRFQRSDGDTRNAILAEFELTGLGKVSGGIK